MVTLEKVSPLLPQWPSSRLAKTKTNPFFKDISFYAIKLFKADLNRPDGIQCNIPDYLWPVLTVISGVKTTDVTDAANPLIHFLFSVSHQVEDTVNGLDVEYEAVLQVLLVERQPSVHLREKSLA